jgi:hypothetical protein
MAQLHYLSGGCENPCQKNGLPRAKFEDLMSRQS